MLRRLRWRLGLRVEGWTRREWVAWHNQSCPPVKDYEIDAVYHCLTLEPRDDEVDP